MFKCPYCEYKNKVIDKITEHIYDYHTRKVYDEWKKYGFEIVKKTVKVVQVKVRCPYCGEKATIGNGDRGGDFGWCAVHQMFSIEYI
jgi:hypothetical protein